MSPKDEVCVMNTDLNSELPLESPTQIPSNASSPLSPENGHSSGEEVLPTNSSTKSHHVPEDIEGHPTLENLLKNWYNEFNIPLNAMKSLLKILKPLDDSLPTDPRTLLKTRSLEIEKNENGEFIYLGLEEGIRKNIKFEITGVDIIKLDMNIDGVQVYKSKNTSFWPILCSCSNTLESSYDSSAPFIVALFYGECKPEINHYMETIHYRITKSIAYGDRYKWKKFQNSVKISYSRCSR